MLHLLSRVDHRPAELSVGSVPCSRKRVVDEAFDALLGVPDRGLGLPWPEMAPGVVDLAAERLRDGDAVKTDIPVILGRRGAREMASQFADLDVTAAQPVAL